MDRDDELSLSLTYRIITGTRLKARPRSEQRARPSVLLYVLCLQLTYIFRHFQKTTGKLGFNDKSMDFSVLF